MSAFSGVYVFGNSLVDSGNALDLAETYDLLPFAGLPDGAPTEAKGYYKGRFTDGWNVADLVSNKYLGIPTKPVFPFGFVSYPFQGDPDGDNLNFAYGGAQIRKADEPVPDLDDQTDAFRDAVDGDADPNALHLVVIGGNDVRELVQKSGPIPSLATAQAILQSAANELIEEVRQLIQAGARHILVAGTPDMGVQPYYNGLPDEALRRATATQYSQMLEDMIAPQWAALVAAFPAADLDYFSLTGFQDEMLGKLEQLYPASELYPINESDIIFFDQVHPTAQVHALAAAAMIDQLSAAPAGDAIRMATPDLRLNGGIGAKGEVDRLTFVLAANTAYTFEMLGLSSGPLTGESWDTLADPNLRITGPGGTLVAANDDGGLGLDAHVQFTTVQAGAYTVELSGVGNLTGAYLLQADNQTVRGDVYTVTSAAALIVEGPGGGSDTIKASVSYTLGSGVSVEKLMTTAAGGTAAIALTGNEIRQTIIGNDGNNMIDGKGGNDELRGRLGDDSFAFTTPIGSGNVDVIKDYDAARDTILLDDAVFAGLPIGGLAAGALRIGTTALDADDRVIFDPATRKLFFDSDGAGGQAQVQFATLAGINLNLAASDFFVI